MSEDLTDYTWRGDTWWVVADRTCPECGESITSNGRVHACTGRYKNECKWWETV